MLKIVAHVMLLRNIDQASGLCNGTRLRVSMIGKKVIKAITLNGSRPNENVLIHAYIFHYNMHNTSSYKFKQQILVHLLHAFDLHVMSRKKFV